MAATGLAIGRQLAELMGGTISVYSAPSRGSELSFELALAHAACRLCLAAPRRA